ncbi:hypothetical protein BH20VER2_BH20VER2_03320 [soil metagenome]
MPLTNLQQEVLRLLARFRSPESYLAGGTLVNQRSGTPRYSQDLDIFHDAEEAVGRFAEHDAQVLGREGFQISWDMQRPALYRGVASRRGEAVRLEWALDSAFRFFPVEADDEVGFRLHPADVALNKSLALGGRREARDFIDVLYLHRTYLSLGAMCWGACAKDPGFTPEFLLQEMSRNVNFRPEEFEVLTLAEPFDLVAAKREWLTAVDAARALFEMLPAGEVGCLYLDKSKPVTPADSDEVGTLQRHYGSWRGSWPAVR